MINAITIAQFNKLNFVDTASMEKTFGVDDYNLSELMNPPVIENFLSYSININFQSFHF